MKIVLVAAGMLAAMLTVPALADIKIGVVNYNRLLQESPQAKAAQETLRSEFAAKQRELQSTQAALKAKEDKVQKDGATMSAEERARLEKELKDGARDYQQKLTNYQDDMNTRQNEELSRVQGALVEEVQTYATAQRYDLVVAEGVIYAAPSLDITAQVLSALQAHAAAQPKPAAPVAAPAPAKTPAGK